MKFLLVLAQIHENFRKQELEALAELYHIKCDFGDHKLDSPFMMIDLESEQVAAQLVQRSILTKAIYRVFGHGKTIEEMHEDAQKDLEQYSDYHTTEHKFEFLSFHGKRPRDDKLRVLKQFGYMNLQGPISLKNPECVFTIWEQYRVYDPVPLELWLTKFVAESDRRTVDKYNLKKRPFIGTTSFDAELSLVTCNIAKIKAHDLVYDPFSGTGSFPVAAAKYHAQCFGTDIDVRSLKGYEKNFKQYNTSAYFGDAICMDFTHNAFRKDLMFDAIISDPPYGVREGLKVCGASEKDLPRFMEKASLKIGDEYAHRRRDYVQPKIQYSFDLLLQNILDFAGQRLIPGGRLTFWLPLPEVDGEQQFPQHKHLKQVNACAQHFNKWTRWLLTYERRQIGEEGPDKAISLVSFREHYYNRSHEEKLASGNQGTESD